QSLCDYTNFQYANEELYASKYYLWDKPVLTKKIYYSKLNDTLQIIENFYSKNYQIVDTGLVIKQFAKISNLDYTDILGQTYDPLRNPYSYINSFYQYGLSEFTIGNKRLNKIVNK